MKPFHAALIAGAVLCVAGGQVLAADVAQDFNRRAAEREVASFRALDRDGDGRLTFAEVYGDVDMQARFQDMDINGDHAVTTAEFAHYIRQRYGVDVSMPTKSKVEAAAPGAAGTRERSTQ